ncbi:MAG: hypothetical protein ACRDQA_05040 [Nocardioidaceae bacterium]
MTTPYDDSPGRDEPEVPDDVSPVGVPGRDQGHQTFVVVLAVTVALLALVFTLGWVVYHHLTGS